MEMKQVESSNISAIGHAGHTMVVQFKNGTKYRYENVSAELYQRILDAESVGKAFNELVKKNPTAHPYAKL